MTMPIATNTLFYGDNLPILREHIPDESVDLVYIEYYPEDKYSPSCLMLGFSKTKRPLHLQVSYTDSERVRIITLYEPDSVEWIEFKERR